MTGPDAHAEDHDHAGVTPDLPDTTPTWASQHEKEQADE
jgi:hypothetical protein